MSAEVSTVAVARLAATATESLDDVVRLDEGAVGEFSTYGPGLRVGGVRVTRRAGEPDRIEVRAVVRLGRPVTRIADDIRTEVAAELIRQFPDGHDIGIDVHIVDVEGPANDDTDTGTDDRPSRALR